MGFLSDVRYALRVLGKSPGFAAVAVLALAFGIGVNSAIFTLLNAIALRPLPIRDAREVLTMYQRMEGLKNRNVHGSKSYFSYPEYLAYRDQNQVFSGLAAYAVANLTLAGTEARAVQGHLATCNYFEVLTGPLAMGRGFLSEDCAARGRNPVVVLSHAFWQRQFNSDPQILGRTLLLNRTWFTVVGVAPRGYAGSSLFTADMWAPLTMVDAWKPGKSDFLNATDLSWLEVSGRLKPGVSLPRARADLAVIASRIDQAQPGKKTTLSVDRATFMNNPEMRLPVLGVGAVVLAAVSLVLLIACANLANLLLARAAVRRKEIAVRLAVGATRARLIRQLLTESLLLSIAGGALGLLASWWALRGLIPLVLSKMSPEAPDFALNMSVDIRILLYSLAVSFVTGVAFGLLPATQASRLDLSSELKCASGAGGRAHGRLRGALVTAQVSVCMVLLVGAGLLSRGLSAAQTIDPGFNLKGVTVASFDLERQGYDQARAAMFNQRLAERLAAMPGVASVATTAVVPLSGANHGNMISIEGGESIQVSLTRASANYFELLGVPIIQGREFEAREMQTGSSAAIISESTARRLWPNQNPIGRRLRLAGGNSSWDVVGVAKDIRHKNLSQVDPVFLYMPATPQEQLGMEMLVRGSSNFAKAYSRRSAITRSECPGPHEHVGE